MSKSRSDRAFCRLLKRIRSFHTPTGLMIFAVPAHRIMTRQLLHLHGGSPATETPQRGQHQASAHEDLDGEHYILGERQITRRVVVIDNTGSLFECYPFTLPLSVYFIFDFHPCNLL